MLLADCWVSTSFHSSKEYLGWIAFSLIIANQINNEAVVFFQPSWKISATSQRCCVQCHQDISKESLIMN